MLHACMTYLFDFQFFIFTLSDRMQSNTQASSREKYSCVNNWTNRERQKGKEASEKHIIYGLWFLCVKTSVSKYFAHQIINIF